MEREDLPRASGTLRALFRGGEATDLIKAKQTRERKLKTALRAVVVDAVGLGKLTWGSFVEGVEEPDEKIMRKQVDNTRVRMVVPLTGSQAHDFQLVPFGDEGSGGRRDKHGRGARECLYRLQSARRPSAIRTGERRKKRVHFARSLIA
jgi:hypothetical protein